MHDKQSLECNLIVDDDFMNKDVSELEQGDFLCDYLKDCYKHQRHFIYCCR